MTNITRFFPIFVFASVLAAGISQPAAADTCASAPVVARGDESQFIWLAKTKARASWRAKVRAMTVLGPNYSNWARAQDTEERCLSGPAGTVCIFSGTPCRP